MELINAINKNNVSSDYASVKAFLTAEPYNLLVKDDETMHPNLYMVTYRKESDDFTNPVVQVCRGIVLEKTTNKIVCYTFNRGKDLVVSPRVGAGEVALDAWASNIGWDDCEVEEAIDGTQIKLYYYDGEWRVSTTRCLDARKAFWYSTRSFYDLFMDACRCSPGFNLDAMDKTLCYSFVLKHPENRIVVMYGKPELTLVMVRSTDPATGYAKIPLSGSGVTGVPLPRSFKHLFSGYDALVHHALNEVKIVSEGFVIRAKDGQQVKLKYNSYCALREIRGDTWNMLYRYLELRGSKADLENYYQFFPEYKREFAFYESQIQRFAKFIHRVYVNSRIRKGGVEIIPEFLRVTIYKLHGRYLEEKTPRTVEKVQELLNALHAKQLCALLTQNAEHEAGVKAAMAAGAAADAGEAEQPKVTPPSA